MNKKPAREFDRLAAEHEAHGRVDNSKFEDRLNGVIRVEWFEAGARWQFNKDLAEIERLEAMLEIAAENVKNAKGILLRVGVDDKHPLSGVLGFLNKALAEIERTKK